MRVQGSLPAAAAAARAPGVRRAQLQHAAGSRRRRRRRRAVTQPQPQPQRIPCGRCDRRERRCCRCCCATRCSTGRRSWRQPGSHAHGCHGFLAHSTGLSTGRRCDGRASRFSRRRRRRQRRLLGWRRSGGQGWPRCVVCTAECHASALESKCETCFTCSEALDETAGCWSSQAETTCLSMHSGLQAWQALR